MVLFGVEVILTWPYFVVSSLPTGTWPTLPLRCHSGLTGVVGSALWLGLDWIVNRVTRREGV